LTYGVKGLVTQIPLNSIVGRPSEWAMNKDVLKDAKKKYLFIGCVLFPMFLFIMGLDLLGILFQCGLFCINSILKVVLKRKTSVAEVFTAIVSALMTVLFPFSYSSFGLISYALNAGV
jgi:hypothetical protein